MLSEKKRYRWSFFLGNLPSSSGFLLLNVHFVFKAENFILSLLSTCASSFLCWFFLLWKNFRLNEVRKLSALCFKVLHNSDRSAECTHFKLYRFFTIELLFLRARANNQIYSDDFHKYCKHWMRGKSRTSHAICREQQKRKTELAN